MVYRTSEGWATKLPHGSNVRKGLLKSCVALLETPARIGRVARALPDVYDRLALQARASRPTLGVEPSLVEFGAWAVREGWAARSEAADRATLLLGARTGRFEAILLDGHPPEAGTFAWLLADDGAVRGLVPPEGEAALLQVARGMHFSPTPWPPDAERAPTPPRDSGNVRGGAERGSVAATLPFRVTRLAGEAREWFAQNRIFHGAASLGELRVVPTPDGATHGAVGVAMGDPGFMLVLACACAVAAKAAATP